MFQTASRMTSSSNNNNQAPRQGAPTVGGNPGDMSQRLGFSGVNPADMAAILRQSGEGQQQIQVDRELPLSYSVQLKPCEG